MNRAIYESKIERLPDVPGCWLWTGTLRRGTYGVLNDCNVVRYVHRIAYALAHGLPLDFEGQVHHKCHVRCCVNPEHLELVTPEEHAALHIDDAQHALNPNWELGLCKRGHSMEDAYVRRDTGTRMCRTCITMRWKAYLPLRKAVVLPRNCIECGRSFSPRRNRTARYCGQKCRMDRFLRARRAA